MESALMVVGRFVIILVTVIGLLISPIAFFIGWIKGTSDSQPHGKASLDNAVAIRSPDKRLVATTALYDRGGAASHAVFVVYISSAGSSPLKEDAVFTAARTDRTPSIIWTDAKTIKITCKSAEVTSFTNTWFEKKKTACPLQSTSTAAIEAICQDFEAYA